MTDKSLEKEKRKTVSTIKFVILLIVATGIFASAAVVTKPNEYSVIKQFGQITSVREEGLSFKIPIIQTVTKVDKEIMFYDIAPSDVITSDKKTMIVDAYVLWRITDPIVYMRTLSGSNENAEGRLNTVIYNAIKNTISSMTQNAVILSRDGKVNVSDIDEETITNDLVLDNDDEGTQDVIEIKSLTDQIMAAIPSMEESYGIEVVKAEVKILDLPDANKDAVYERMISERENVAAAYVAQGKSEAQMIKNTTDREISIMVAEAEAEAEKIIAEGESEYMKILSDAYNDPEKADFYSFVRSLDAAKASLKSSDNTLILDANSPIAQIFYNK